MLRILIRLSKKKILIFPIFFLQVSFIMSTDLMTSSLPNMDMTELDKLSDRLGKFKSPSRLPKPEISPKPAYLAAQLAKHKMVESTTESKIGNFY